jgi:hypothetical protein
MSTKSTELAKDRTYVKVETPVTIRNALDSQFKGPLFVTKIIGTVVLLLLAVFALTAPFVSPVREMVGWYFYIHIFVVVIALIFLFTRVIPPPGNTSESRRRRFMVRANDKRLGRAGFDSSGIAFTRIAADRRTLEITVTSDWFGRLPEVRLRDAQNFWWLWTTVYLPYDGPDKAYVRLVDSQGNEVGGSHSQTGSLVWAK